MLLALGIIALTAYVAVRGPEYAYDSASYQILGDRLIADRFDYATYLSHTRYSYPPVQYIGWITLVAFSRLAFGASYGMAIVAINVVVVAATVAVVGILAARGTGNSRVGVAAGLITIGSYDLTEWVRYVLSDATFAALAFAPFALLALGVLGARRARLIFVAAVTLLGIAFVSRPTGWPLLPVFAAGAVAFHRRREATALLERKPWVVGASVAVVIGASAIAFLIFARIMQHPELWPFKSGHGVLQYTLDRIRVGEVVSDRRETFHLPPVSYADHVWLTLDRFAHFFWMTAAGFSSRHRILAVTFYVPLYALSAFALMRASSRAWLQGSTRAVVLGSALTILTTAAFHAMAQVDFDWRYRAPLMPHFALLAAIGGGMALSSLRARRRRLGLPS